VDRIDRIKRIRMGLSKGVVIHFQFQSRLFSRKKAVKAKRVTPWMTHMAHPWTAPIASGVKMSREYRE
jgi:hypothetical protein